MRFRRANGPLAVRAIAGAHVVILAIDIEPEPWGTVTQAAHKDGPKGRPRVFHGAWT